MIRDKHWSALALAPLLLIAAGCAERMGTPETPETMQPAAGRSQTTVSMDPQRAQQPARPSVGVAGIDIASGPVGRYLADSSGRALYLFEADKGAQGSTCYDACAQAWPPVITSGLPSSLSAELDGTKLGTVARRDGTLQATYAGWPLYYYVKDRSAGDIHGQDLMDFGAEWYLVTPAGGKLEGKPTMESPAITEPPATEPTPMPPIDEPEPSEPPSGAPPDPGGIY
jgi:predicted lipoprotein with Yx(FWY)xxD motif